MSEKIKVLKYMVELLAIESWDDRIEEICQQEQMKSVLFLSKAILEQAMMSENYRDKIQEFNLLLPGEEDILGRKSILFCEKHHLQFEEKFLKSMLQGFQERGRSIYIIGDDYKKIEMFKQYCKESYVELKITGVFVGTQHMDDEVLLNDINVTCPDIILVAIAPQFQENWILSNVDKLNGKVCIGANILVERLLESYKEELGGEEELKFYRKLKQMKRRFINKWKRKVFLSEYERYMEQIEGQGIINEKG
ncbi:MAG: WecB/TagA/CpsF family glycosyltransferase [Lachnospiraceae bacterium]|nr:WecB/TagA/CpsF family glycosyltransferase [Lachnospiraceae bacterium]